MRYPTTRTLVGLVAALLLGAHAAPALEPAGWNPTGQAARKSGFLCARDVGGGTEYGIWVDPQSRSRAYYRLELPPSARFDGALAYAHPYDVPGDYWRASAEVTVEGVFTSAEAIRPAGISGAMSWRPGAASLDPEALAEVLTQIAARPQDDEQARSIDERSMTRLLRRGLAGRLAQALAGAR